MNTNKVKALMMRAGPAMAAVLLGACALPPPKAPAPYWEGQSATTAMPAAPGTPRAAESPPTTQIWGDTPEVSAPSLVESVLYPGTGQFVRSRPSPVEVAPGSGDITLNFEATDIREVANTILGRLLQLNYLVDPEVQGQVTLQTSQPIEREAVLRVFEDVLEANGAALVQRDGLYQVVPAARAARSAPLRSPRGYATRVVPLSFVSAAEMSEILLPFSPEEGILRVDRARNLLVLAGSTRELNQMQELIETFDVDWLQGMSVGLVSVQFARADVIAQELGALIGEATPAASMIRLVPLERLNAIMVVTPQARYLQEMRDWIGRLDQPIGGEGRRLYVYRVENGRAEELGEILRELFAPPGERAADVPELRAPEVAPGLIGTTLYSPVVNASGTPPAAIVAPPSSASLAGAEVGVIADKSNNALVILATPADFRKVESALRQLDIPPMQVLVEATIVDVTLSDELSYGVQWFFNNSLGGNRTGSGQVGQALAFGSGFGYTITNAGGEIRALLRALAAEGKVNVLSSPSLMVLDNQTATIRVGDQQPVTTSIITDRGVIAESVQFKDTGVILEVTPRVNSGGLITLDVRQEVTDVGEVDPASGQRAFLQRNIGSIVAVQSGDTVVLGGLIRENRSDTRSGVPMLHRLPLVGNLFGQTVTTASRSELLVLITPRAVRSREDAGKITQEFRHKLGNLKDWAPELERWVEPEPMLDDAEETP